MTPERLVHRRLYFFEVFVLVNLIIVLIMLGSAAPIALRSLISSGVPFAVLLIVYGGIGVAIRATVLFFRGRRHREYLARVRRIGWLTDLLRIVGVGAIGIDTYAWIKLTLPLEHPRLFDQQLWDLDSALFFGHSPNIFFLTLFGQPYTLAAIDWSYARIFVWSMSVAFTFILSAPSRRLRLAFQTSNMLMWITCAWLYFSLPSLGPAYRFPEVWLPLEKMLPVTQATQAILMRNYQNVLKITTGTAEDVVLLYGIAAFPSMHVAFQTFAFLWTRRIWVQGQVLFAIFVVVIFIGSIVTGWHYLIDGVAGVALAAVAYLIGSRMWRVKRWLRLRAG